jgi:hypothetical protein
LPLFGCKQLLFALHAHRQSAFFLFDVPGLFFGDEIQCNTDMGRASRLISLCGTQEKQLMMADRRRDRDDNALSFSFASCAVTMAHICLYSPYCKTQRSI